MTKDLRLDTCRWFLAAAKKYGLGLQCWSRSWTLSPFKSHFCNVSSCSECSPNSNIIIFTQAWNSFFSLLCNSIISKFQISTHSLFWFLPPIFYSMTPGRINAWFPTNVSDDSTLSFLVFSPSTRVLIQPILEGLDQNIPEYQSIWGPEFMYKFVSWKYPKLSLWPHGNLEV